MIIIAFILLLVIALLGLVYLLNRFHRFEWIRKIGEERKKLSWLLAALPVFVIILFFYIKTASTTLFVLHLMAFWFLCDLANLVIRRIRGKDFKRYYAGACAIVITVAYLTVGWYNCHHVYQTEYGVKTEKAMGGRGLRVVQISDSHVGATFDGEGFAEYMKEVQETDPDVVVITGDYVDDDTTREDLVASCGALGNLKTTYGVYYVFGNHDKGYFDQRDFSEADLRRELEKNQVKILEDENVLLDDRFYIIGRQDASSAERADMASLVEGLDTSKYKIVLDHQPNAFDEQAESGVDLVLTGHTHGGQMFPIGITGVLSGQYDRAYGMEKRKDTTFVVSSGISDWAIPFKTAAFSEYVVIDISPL